MAESGVTFLNKLYLFIFCLGKNWDNLRLLSSITANDNGNSNDNDNDNGNGNSDEDYG